MKLFGWLRARPRALASGGVVTVVAVALTTMAFLYQGMPTAKVDLNDGGVWVTKSSAMLVGHFNDQSKLLDGAARGLSRNLDVLQAADTVVVVDTTESTASVVDPAMVSIGGSGHLPAGAKVALGQSAVAILDTKGRLWVVPASTVASFTAGKTKPVADLGAGADVVVGRDGIVHAVSAKNREIVDVPTDAQGDPGDAAHHALADLPASSKPTITAVGSRAVVLDATNGIVLTADGLHASIPKATTAVLQQPSDEADAVALATPGDLVRVPLDGSAVQKTSARGDGDPAAPVQMDGCVYGAWSGSARYVRECAGTRDDVAKQVPGATSTAQLRFRVNRDIVVLNDVFGGSAWATSDTLQKVDNWQDVTPPEGKEQQQDDQTTDETVQTSLPQRDDVNHNPEAKPDEYGVRPGRTTILPVLENDSDPDGDVLTASAPATTKVGALQPINDGGALQLQVPDDATGGDTFTYTADDGRGGTAQAQVSLAVHPWSENGAPAQKRSTTLTMEAGGTLTYNVLPDWKDPDGDEMTLVSAEAANGDEVEVSADGTLTYRAINGVLGRRDVAVRVSDGTDTGSGVLHIDVRPTGSVVPITTADHVVVRKGDTATVAPLANDYAAGREPLRLTRVDNVTGLNLTPDYSAGTFTVSSDAVGTSYVQYLVAAGSPTAAGIVRVDVIDDKESDLPPVAVRDVALVQAGGEVLVNVLANDADPAGGILVVQSVTVPPGSGVTAAVLGHETVRIGNQGALTGQVIVGYSISNGRTSASGSIVVIPIPAPDTLRPPVAVDDTAIVRVGDVVTIPVLANDHDPNGGTLHVVPQLVAPLPDPKSGEIFVSQDTVRFRASDTPGTVYATYEVVNDSGQKDAGYITIQVVPRNADTDAAPLPKALTARTLAGATVHIPVPLDGIDPDGDSVELTGIASAPQKGRVLSVGADEIVYQALDASAGDDSFTYRVRDRLGAEATATVRVGIAPAPDVNQAPYAVKDVVTIRPGRVVAVPVLANDSDPDGDAIGVVSNGLILPAGLKAVVQGDRVVVTAPSSVGTTSLQYTIRDARGAQAVGVVQVTVKDDVPLLAPIARDDFVDPALVKDGSVDVDVLKNDEDPDGTTTALKLALDSGAPARVVSGGTVRVTLTDADQVIMYTITDPDGLTDAAFVHVPAKGSLPPTLISTKALEVKSGQTVDLPLADYVRAGDGGKVVITEAAKTSAVHGNGDSLVKDQTTLVYTSAAGYFGPDALTFEVTDGTGPDDPKGHKATLTIPITVLPPENQPPTFVNGQLTVAPGEAASILDLRGLTSDPDKGDLAKVMYQIVGGAPDGMSASIDGATLTVSAPANAKKGTAATIGIRLTDGHTPPVDGQVNVTVAASTRPLATANDDVVAEAHQGTTVSVPVLDNDFNPFPDKPLKVVAAAAVTGDGIATVNGSKVDVKIAKDYVGTMVVRYRIQDATADVDREVEGQIKLTVQGRPAQPGKPTVTSVQDRTVVLGWTPPVDNGAEITGYTVASIAGGYSKQCASTTCTLDGLTNNVVYNFTVTATNRVGTSDASLPSEDARPDARPDTPQAPTLTFGDKSLAVARKTPTTPGSPVKSYNLEISPAPLSGSASRTGVTGTSLTWTGLENGTNYTVRVQAVNSAPDPSSWSAWSIAETPAGKPAAPAAPTTARAANVGAQAQMQVTWVAPATNGAPISAYDLDVMQGGSVVRTVHVAGTSTTAAVVMDTSETSYTFRVRATNKAGTGADSAQSAPRRAFTQLGAPGTPTVSDGDNKVTVSFAASAGNGASSSEVKYEYQINSAGSWLRDWVSGGSGSGTTIAGVIGNGHVNNNGSYTVRVRSYAAIDGSSYSSAASGVSAAAQPYGQIGSPTAKASVSGTTVTYTWTSPAANGRPVTTQISIDGGSWQTVAANSSKSAGYAYSTSHKFTVRTSAAGSTTTSATSNTVTTVDKPAPPAPSATLSKGPSNGGTTHFLVVTTKNFPAGDYHYKCIADGSAFGDNAGYTQHFPANGPVQLNCWYGYPGHTVWVSITEPGVSTNHVVW